MPSSSRFCYPLKNIVALLTWAFRIAPCFFTSELRLFLPPEAARSSPHIVSRRNSNKSQNSRAGVETRPYKISNSYRHGVAFKFYCNITAISY